MSRVLEYQIATLENFHSSRAPVNNLRPDHRQHGFDVIAEKLERMKAGEVVLP
jgi:hypothetical protein